MDNFVLKGKKISFLLEFGLFNILLLSVMFPVVWFQFLTLSCWSPLSGSLCGCAYSLEQFYQGNVVRLLLLAAGLPVLILVEMLVLRLEIAKDSPKHFTLWLEYASKNVLRSLPSMFLLFAAMALPEAKFIYALIALLGIWSMFGAWGFHSLLSPVSMLRGRNDLQLRPQLKYILIYLLLSGAVLPTIFFSRAHACMDRAPVSTVKANMHTFQTIVETYAVDWGGVYAANIQQLKTEAKQGGRTYWKDFTNPYTAEIGEAKSYAMMPTKLKALMATPEYQAYFAKSYTDILGIRIYKRPAISLGAPSEAGLVLYDYSSPTRYFIYGLDKNGNLIRDKGQNFFLSNS